MTLFSDVSSNEQDLSVTRLSTESVSIGGKLCVNFIVHIPKAVASHLGEARQVLRALKTPVSR